MNVKEIDFSTGDVYLEGSGVVDCKVPQLNSHCVISFKILPKGLLEKFNGDAERARKDLEERVMKRSKGLLKLVDFATAPPFWKLDVSKFDDAL